jgi:hypothetical protein
MTWQLFALIQTIVFSVGLVTALGLRNRRLRRRNDELLTLCSQAHEELLNVTGKLSEIETTAPPEQMLGERVKALTGEDPVIVVRRMVLDNEISPKGDFAARLAEHLASQQEEPPDEEEFARRWRAIRAECHQLAMFLVADNPDCLAAIEQIFEVVEPLDRAYNIDLPPLELPSRAKQEDAGDVAKADHTANADEAQKDAPASATGTG